MYYKHGVGKFCMYVVELFITIKWKLFVTNLVKCFFVCGKRKDYVHVCIIENTNFIGTLYTGVLAE